MMVVAFILVIIIVNEDVNPTFKIAWLIPILLFPIFGAPLYFIFGSKKLTNKVVKRLNKSFVATKEILPQNDSYFAEVKEIDQSIYKQVNYINNTSYSPLYKNTETTFLSSGEIFFKKLIMELKKAEKFIFLEYFIIAKGKMWDTVLEILKEKAKQGVEIKLMYDDLGTINLLDKNYPKELSACGIETVIFNKYHASMDSFLNYRDHRKITVIDGNVGFTGGINLADEYINEVKRFGHWKDSSVMIKGDGVSRLTVMFLQLWYSVTKNSVKVSEFKNYLNTKSYDNDGYVQPFWDSPISGHLTAELAYMNMINNAKKYIYITTPYLILDNEMITALSMASESGIDVRIITPHIPDKKYVFYVTRSNYNVLLKAGVKIYEYTPGFMHSKTIVSDDSVCIVGTTNFDFRSFYLHFENGVLMYNSKCVHEVREEFDKLLVESHEITLKACEDFPFLLKLKGKLFKLFSPLI